MRWYSGFRVLLVAAVLGTTAMAARSLWAQGAPSGAPAAAPAGGAPGAPAPRKSVNPFAIVIDNIDFVFVIILICSVIGVALIIQGFIKARASVMIPESSTNHIRELIGAKRFKELIEFTETDPSFVSKALNPALKRAPSFAAMKEAMETAIGEQTAQEFRRIEYLNIIGNLGPLLGLLGTVIGMIDSFQQMNLAEGAANPKDLAGGISKALCHTMLGLMLALPCLAAFGVLRTLVDRLTVQGALIAEELLLMVKPAEARPATAPAVRPAATPQPVPAAAVRKPAAPTAPPAVPTP